jgi:hypothetical protein
MRIARAPEHASRWALCRVFCPTSAISRAAGNELRQSIVGRRQLRHEGEIGIYEQRVRVLGALRLTPSGSPERAFTALHGVVRSDAAEQPGRTGDYSSLAGVDFLGLERCGRRGLRGRGVLWGRVETKEVDDAMEQSVWG